MIDGSGSLFNFSQVGAEGRQAGRLYVFRCMYTPRELRTVAGDLSSIDLYRTYLGSIHLLSVFNLSVSTETLIKCPQEKKTGESLLLQMCCMRMCSVPRASSIDRSMHSLTDGLSVPPPPRPSVYQPAFLHQSNDIHENKGKNKKKKEKEKQRSTLLKEERARTHQSIEICRSWRDCAISLDVE